MNPWMPINAAVAHVHAAVNPVGMPNPAGMPMNAVVIPMNAAALQMNGAWMPINAAGMPMSETASLLRGFALAAMDRTTTALPEEAEPSYIFYDVAAQYDTSPYELNHFPPAPLPPQSPEQFVVRLKAHMRCSDSVYSFAIAIMERIARSEDGLECNSANFSRLFTAVVVRCILLLDEPKLDMSYYAKVLRTKATALNKLLSTLHKILGGPGDLPDTEERNEAVAKYTSA